MKPFNGPRSQGGWVAALATAAAAAYNSYSARKQKDKDKKDASDLSKEGFRRQAWLDQQSRKWQLEDRKYKEDAIGGFRNAGPYTADSFPGFQTPTPTSTAGLSDWDPEQGIPGIGLMGKAA